MTSKKTVDFAIVGGGQAGTILAHTLKSKDPIARVVLIDDIQPNVSSKIAAGIINPITGRVMTLTWKANELFSFANQYYPKLQAEIGEEFFYSLPIYRVLQSSGDQNDWIGESSNPQYHRFLDNPEVVELEGVNNPFGALRIKGGGWLNVSKFLDVIRNVAVFQRVSGTIDTTSTKSIESDLSNLGIVAKDVVLCTGYRAAGDGITKDLGWSPVRGELMRITHHNLPSDKIINKGCFILPIGKSEWLLGATYNHQLDLGITEAGKEQLLNKFNQLVSGTPTILEHRWGIRPATKDRRPMIGALAPNLHLFNGFGSKGVSLTPFFSDRFADTLLANKDWTDPETYLFRFSG